MLFSGKCFSFPEKYDISGKCLGISRTFFSYLGKNVIYTKTFLDAFFIRKVPLKAFPPPQLLEASYAPVPIMSKLFSTLWENRKVVFTKIAGKNDHKISTSTLGKLTQVSVIESRWLGPQKQELV
jgi:hypothetical protein